MDWKHWKNPQNQKLWAVCCMLGERDKKTLDVLKNLNRPIKNNSVIIFNSLILLKPSNKPSSFSLTTCPPHVSYLWDERFRDLKKEQNCHCCLVKRSKKTTDGYSHLYRLLETCVFQYFHADVTWVKRIIAPDTAGIVPTLELVENLFVCTWVFA